MSSVSENPSTMTVEPYRPPRRDLREWDALSASADEFRFRFSDAASREFCAFARGIDARVDLENIAPHAEVLQEFAADVERCREHLDSGAGIAIIDPISGLSPRQKQILSWTVSRMLGTPLVQSSEGNRLVHVFDRDRTKRMEDGARYHQTRQGGSIHTDNVNAPDPWEYLVFACVEPALVGGESIVVNGYGVHRYLSDHVPDALRILEQPFVWEYRGISDDVYRAPIVTYGGNGDPYFRYLRPYLESAHRKVDQPLTDDQMWALDVLDSVLDVSDLQLRIRMKAGEILITFDSQMFHGRTTFADHANATDMNASTNRSTPLRRTFERTWVRSNNLACAEETS